MRHARRVVALQRSAGRCRQAGHIAAAEQLYRRALAVAERHLTADDLTTARVRNDLAVLLKTPAASTKPRSCTRPPAPC
jgi:hypothetical protein